MNAQHQQEIQKFVTEFHLPRYRELPDFGLHLEQVTRYVSRFIPAPVTGSMVSNYVKQKIIPGPVKKSYPRESLAYLIFLSYIKTVMPLEDIRLMIGIQKNSYSLEVAYDYFCDELENLLQYACGMKETPEFIGVTHTEEKALLRTALLSITYKVYLDQSVKLIRANGTKQQETPV